MKIGDTLPTDETFRMATYSTVLQNGETLENATCSTTEGAAKFFPNTMEGRP
jgi:hypothetical protein